MNNNIPKKNIIAYQYLYEIEIALRELIIFFLQDLYGSKWYKSRLPGDVLEKYKKGIKYEHSIKWSNFIPHHPIYYIDFSDLKKVIQKSDNWNSVFKKIFENKEIFSSSITEIEFIRNKIAHNRIISNDDLNILKSSRTKFIQMIGEAKFNELISKCTIAVDLVEQLKELNKIAEQSFNAIIKYEVFSEMDRVIQITSLWWFEKDYLKYDLDNMNDYLKLLNEYCSFTRKRGMGHKMEKWVKESRVQEIHKESQKSLIKNISYYGEN
jgi:hypothetical protein